MNNPKTTSNWNRAARSLGITCLLGATAIAAWAAQTDISSTPFSASEVQAKPNIMLLMDTSESMKWTHMPDEVESVIGRDAVGYRNSSCNVLYFNPSSSYVQPKYPDGSSFPLPNFNAARYDAFDTTSLAVVDLDSAFRAYDTNTLRIGGFNDAAQPAYYWTHDTPLANYKATACTDVPPDATTSSFRASDGGIWTRTQAAAMTSAQRTSFALWYAYYRLRMSLTKSAASLAFTPLTDSFRVGFITMKPKDTDASPTINATKYLAIADFDSTQRTLWFTKLFSQKAIGTSPAREGLARVGRHYAGKQDGINGGMTGDPVQYYCQQNFTIMTTDGYWNDNNESKSLSGGFLGGPVDVTGQALVGQRDGTLTGPAGDTPRPIWDGVPDSSQVITDKQVQFSSAPCGTYFNKSTTQMNQSTTQITVAKSQTTQVTMQNLQSTSQTFQSDTQATVSTSQTTQSTFQNLQSTNQNRQNVFQALQSTAQVTQRTLQNFASTNQNLQSTVQNLQNSSQSMSNSSHVEQTVSIARQNTTQRLRSTTQNVQSTTQVFTGTIQRLSSTVQNLQSTVQNLQSTTQTTQSTVQNLQSTLQNLRSTSQTTQSSTQTTATTSQIFQDTYQVSQATSQTAVTTVQVRKATTQDASCPDAGEGCSAVPTGSCTPNPGTSHCETYTTGPTLVATCTNELASSGNNYVKTTCSTSGSGPTPAASCTPQTANAGNSYTTTTCNPIVTGPTPVASCNPASAGSGNAYTTTTCPATVSPPTAVMSCTPAAASSSNSYTTTNCTTQSVGPTGVASCSPVSPTMGNSYTTTSCGNNNVPSAPVASCTPASPTSGNSYTTVSCGSVITTDVPVLTCSTGSPTSGNNYTTTTCGSNVTNNVPVASCTPVPATSGNSYVATTCPTPITTGPNGVSSCTPIAASSGNSFVATTCGNNNTTNVPVLACTATGPTSGNGYTDTTCPAPLTTTNVPVATCSASGANAGNSFVATSCPAPITTTNVPVASCTAAAANSGNSYITTSCPAPITTGPTAVASCSPNAATSGNSWTETTCTPNNTNNVPVATCTPVSPTSGNGYTTTTCPAAITTTNVPVASCTDAAATSGNAWTATACSDNNATGTAVASCSPSGPTSGNNFTTTTCPGSTIVSGPTPVASCTPDAPTAGNGYQQTTCNTIANSTPSGTCAPQTGNSGNGFVTITCTTLTNFNVPVATCTPQTGSSGNGWNDITCPAPNVTNNVPVLTCTSAAAASGNSYTTTSCPSPIVSGPTPVLSCTAAAADGSNSWTTTTCPTPATTGPFGVSACTPVTASSGNSYTATICGNNTTTDVPVVSCTPLSPDSGNGYTTTTCGNNNASNVPVATCVPQTGNSVNNWVTINCAASVTTTNVPVSSCSPAGANSGNNFTTTTCSTNNAPNTPSGSCVPITAAPGNNWTTTTCPTLTTGPTAAASCTPITGDSGNGWKTTTCGNNNTSNVAVSSCTPMSPDSSNGYLLRTCNTILTTNVPVQTCSTSPATSANQWTGTTCTPVNTNAPSGTCAPITATSANNWTTTTCPVIVTPATGASSCTAQGPTSANNWTTTTCPTNTSTGPDPVATCNPQAASADNSWKATTCNPVTTGPTLVTTCDPAAANAANQYTQTTCAPVSGSKLRYVLTTTVTTGNVSGGILINPVVTTTVAPEADVSGVCVAPPSVVTIPSPNPQPAGPIAGPMPTGSCTAWPCTDSVNLNNPQSINSLADVAQYYYITDLRPQAVWGFAKGYDDEAAGKGVPSVGNGPEDDRRHWQHMTTFSIALGISGTLQYKQDYKTATTGDFADIRTGVKNWPLWPDPALVTSTPDNYGNDKRLWNDPKSIDDFWHAAVNGRGQYFNATDPRSVINGIANALYNIGTRTRAGSGPGTSTLTPTVGNNFAYLASYRTTFWDGDVAAFPINLATGAIDQSSPFWSAAVKLSDKAKDSCDSRNIYLIRTDGTKSNNLANFTSGTSYCDASGNPAGTLPDDLNATELANFGALPISLLSQYPSMSDGTFGTPDQRSAAAGSNLINFLRGQRQYEDFQAGVAGKLYRKRQNVLGDIVGGQPVFVQAPFASYSDLDYGTFKNANVGRAAMIYVAANDGMLHAFHAETTGTLAGTEAWAVIPSAMLPNLNKLADGNYSANHRYFVDAAPVVSDIKAGSNWKTLLVGGFNAGGKGFYALDVTDPAAPAARWEFKPTPGACPSDLVTATAAAGNTGDCNIGLSFGQPVITKLTASGTWVVLLTSGYNNVNGASNGGDGQGFLYVLDAWTGTIKYKISTGVGDATTPSGLAQINNYVDSVNTDNTALRAYGTDLLGNIWRFDINDNIAPTGREARLVGTAKDSASTPQPITVKPEIGEIGGKTMIFVGTGRFLGATDITDTQQQSIYGVVDPMVGTVSPSYSNLRSVLAPLAFTTVGTTRSIACTGTTAQCGSASGWVVDLPESGERVNVDLKLQLGNLAVASNVPDSSDICNPQGHSWFNQLDYKSGLVVPGNIGAVSQRYSQGLIVGFAVIRLPNGQVIGELRFTDTTTGQPSLGGGAGGPSKRISWREVVR